MVALFSKAQFRGDDAMQRAATGYKAQSLVEALGNELFAILHDDRLHPERIHQRITITTHQQKVKVDIIAHLGRLPLSFLLQDDQALLCDAILGITLQKHQETLFSIPQAVENGFLFSLNLFERLDRE